MPARIYRVNHPRTPFQVYLNVPGRKPYRKHFKTEDAAKKHCKQLNRKVSKEGADGVYFGELARSEYAAASRILEPFGINVVDAARYYEDNHSIASRVECRDALEEFLLDKAKANRSPRTVSNIRVRVSAFLDAYCPVFISDLDRNQFKEWFGRKGVTPQTRGNDLRAIRNWLNWCRKRGFLNKDILEGFDAPIIEATSVAILTPEQARKLMEAASAVQGGIMARNFALRLFAGLRSSEIQALEESDILPDGIRVGKGKLRGRRSVRIVPLAENLKGWLKAYPDAPFWPRNYIRLFNQVIEQAGLRSVYKQDICRHSWISYRLAQVQDENQVAREAGNSPDVIYRHYWQLAGDGDSSLFFALALNE